jgi:hypothetical protein
LRKDQISQKLEPIHKFHYEEYEMKVRDWETNCNMSILTYYVHKIYIKAFINQINAYKNVHLIFKHQKVVRHFTKDICQ